MKNKIKNNVLLLFSLLFFVICSGFTLAKGNQQNSYAGNCYVCDAIGCVGAYGPIQVGQVNCFSQGNYCVLIGRWCMAGGQGG